MSTGPENEPRIDRRALLSGAAKAVGAGSLAGMAGSLGVAG